MKKVHREKSGISKQQGHTLLKVVIDADKPGMKEHPAFEMLKDNAKG